MPTEFTGFPKAALTFLRDLEADNDRDWFKANRARYDEHLLAPARLLAADLADLGPVRFFRPYYDTRFRPGPPIKEHISFLLGDIGSGGYYIELSLDALTVGGGIYHPAGDQLDRYRKAIDDGRRARGFAKAIATAEAAGLALLEPDLKRAPRGYPIDHPRIDHLRRKRLVVIARPKPGRWIHTAACGERVRAYLDATQPLVRWLQEQVGPTEQPRPARR